MIEVHSVNRATRLLTIFSIVYSILDANVIYLAPIVTIVIPYRFMKVKDLSKLSENKKILNNLFIFNLISFLLAIVITKNMNLLIFDLALNILISFIYYRILCVFESKQEGVYKNPEAVYDKINKKIEMLETLHSQTYELMKNAKTEKERLSIQSKIDTIQYKIDETKRQLSSIKKEVELKENNENKY